MGSNFIWCDLSALRPDRAAKFYEDVFGWKFESASSKYRYAYCGDVAVAALFDMPPFFRKIKMPSFWMSYIGVESVAAVVSKVTEKGGKVELEDDFFGGKIALIRDPLGAGFTIYEGEIEAGITGVERGGLRTGHTLHVSSQSAVKDFYETLFDWKIVSADEKRWFVSDPNAGKIAEIIESSDEERNGYEYWGITFTVENLQLAHRNIEARGGQVFAETYHGDRPALSVADMDGAAFAIVQCDNN